MRIAIDARELHGRPTGVGRYLAGLLAAWELLPAAATHEFVLIAPAGSGLPPPGRRVTARLGGSGGSGTLWEQISLPRLIRAAQADVFFAPGYTGPLFCPVPMVVAIHDVSFAAHPEWFGRREGLRRRALARLAARRAARVVTISDFSRREIVRHLGVPASKIDVIYPAAGTPAARVPSPDAPHRVLFVGSLFNRRHIPELIAGFARLARTGADVHLDIVGDNRTTPRIDFEALASASGAASRIALRAYVPDDALAGVYAGARAFAFLSDYEGFGLTPLEALAAGVPIVVLDTPVAREVYGEAAIYVAGPDPALIAGAIERVLFDEAERSRILAAAPGTLARYSWQACAAGVLRVLTACARVP